MVVKSSSTSDRCAWSVEVSPAEVDAGAEFTVKCLVAHLPEHGHNRLAVSIRDHHDVELAIAELTQIDDEVFVTDEILLQAPLAEGEHIYRALLAAGEKAGPSCDMVSTEFSFVVKTHAMRLNVWGLPSTSTAGESFTFKAGIKCSCGCNLAGRELCIFDGKGNQIGAGRLRDEVWPGTSALYFAEVEGKAPPAAGSHRWEVRIAAAGSPVPHAAGVLAFEVKVVDAPDYEVTIAALDTGKRTPIKGARVVLHPYRGVTDVDGVAKLRVVRGHYKLLVSASKYLATAKWVEVSESATVRAELTLEPVIDPASYYV